MRKWFVHNAIHVQCFSCAERAQLRGADVVQQQHVRLMDRLEPAAITSVGRFCIVGLGCAGRPILSTGEMYPRIQDRQWLENYRGLPRTFTTDTQTSTPMALGLCGRLGLGLRLASHSLAWTLPRELIHPLALDPTVTQQESIRPLNPRNISCTNDVVKQSANACQSSLYLDNRPTSHQSWPGRTALNEGWSVSSCLGLRQGAVGQRRDDWGKSLGVFDGHMI